MKILSITPLLVMAVWFLAIAVVDYAKGDRLYQNLGLFSSQICFLFAIWMLGV